MDNHKAHPDNALSVRRAGIDTYQEPVVYMRRDCAVCRAEGFAAQTRLQLEVDDRRIIATLNVVDESWLAHGQAALSDSAWAALRPSQGAMVLVSHPPPLNSLSQVRAKICGHALDDAGFTSVIGDVAAGRYSDLHLAAFVTACAGDRLGLDETIALTRAMIAAGDTLQWAHDTVVDKHCVGGLPGNRTTPLVVPIVTACGLVMPKTSSRAITSPAGTADTMEVLAPVDLDVTSMRRVVERTGGCIVWGGSVRLSPADDILIRAERPLDLDSEGLLVASILSKKAAAGSTHVVVDLPVGATAKVRSPQAATSLGRRLKAVGEAFGLQVVVRITDGRQPVGRGIGPALEARDVLAVLRRQSAAPDDLRQRALQLAGDTLELGGAAAPGRGTEVAKRALDDGRAWTKFVDICEAQGGLRALPLARHRHVVAAASGGRVIGIDNRFLARAAKLAGAPKSPAAGAEVHVRLGQIVERGQPLYTLYAEAPGELRYALQYVAESPPVYEIGEPA